MPVAPEPDRPESAAELSRQLTAESEAEARGQIVAQLWELGTPEAVEVLRQRFQVEREAEVKADIVAGLMETKSPETREVRFGILVSAIAPAQPTEVRAAAVQMLTEFEDPRAIALLQNLVQDGSEEIREAAKEALETRREADPK